MSKLICSKDIDDCHSAGETTCYVDEGTIITPSARDQAAKYGIKIVKGCETQCGSESCSTQSSFSSKGIENMTSEDLVALLRQVLSGKIKIPSSCSSTPYQADVHENGLKVVKGSSVVMDNFDTGTVGTNVHFQELVGKNESQMSAGFLTIDHSRFAWKLTYEEIDYIIEGTVTVEIDGKTYTGHAGDVIFVPKNSNVVWGSPDNAKIFYSTYPSNWADLM